MATGSFLTRVKSRITHAPRSPPSPPRDPVLDNDDEVFLNRVMSESLPAAEAVEVPVKTEERDLTQDAQMNVAQKTPLPPTPESESPPKSGPEPDGTGKSDSKWTTKRLWGLVRKNKDMALNKMPKSHKQSTSADASHVQTEPSGDNEAAREEKDMADVLDRLNLAAADNRVFSVNKEMQTLLQRFKLILKDLINGAPTAYNDLESLFTNRDKQLQELFDSLPGFLQKLIMQLPDKLAPEMLAAMAEKAEKSGIDMENAGKAASATTPKLGLKDLATKPAAILGFLRSIVAFLRARFPALLGVNVLWSLALCILLLVLWYCHKRGRDVRLEKERTEEEEENARIDAQGEGADASAKGSSAPAGDSAAAAPAPAPATDDAAGPEEDGQRRLAQDDSGGPAASIQSKVQEKTRRRRIEPYEGT